MSTNPETMAAVFELLASEEIVEATQLQQLQAAFNEKPLSDFATMTPAQFAKEILQNASGFKGAASVAKKIIDFMRDMEFIAPIVQPVVTPVQSVMLVQPEGEDFDALIVKAANGDAKAKSRLHALVSEIAVFVRSLETGSLEVSLSIECYHDYETYNRPRKTWKGIPTETYGSIFQIKELAHPQTGAALDPDDAWMDINAERKVLARYGYLTGALKASDNEDFLIIQLQQEKLQGNLSKLEKAFINAKQTEDPMYMQAQAGLYVQKGGGSAQTGNTFLNDGSTTQALASTASVTSQPVQLRFGPAVYPDFKDLAELYVAGNKANMLDFLIRRAEFLDSWDINSPADIKGVPLEAIILLRAGVYSKVWLFEHAQNVLAQAYGMQAIIPYLGKPKGQFYAAVEQFCPPALAEWVGEILYNPTIGSFHGRPRLSSFTRDTNWKGKRIIERG